MLKTIRYVVSVALILAAVLLFGSRLAPAQGKDSLVGTWVLDFGKSDFKLVAAPQNKTITFTPTDNGFTQKVKISNANGSTDEFDFTGKYDGKEYPMPTISPLNAITLKRVDANTVEQTGIMRKQVVETVTYKISNGGKTLTITTVGTDHANDYIQVYEKQ